MKKAWRVVLILVLIVVILGSICVGVGFLTGADTDRIYSVLDDDYSITDTIQMYETVLGEALTEDYVG